MDAEAQKRAAGEAAAEMVKSGMVVGLGTGSTAAHFVRALASRRLAVVCVASSAATSRQAESLGLRLLDLNNVDAIDLTVDGADEIGPNLDLMKGGGAALLREKLVWEASSRCTVIADKGKRVASLGRFPLAIAVASFGHRTTAARIQSVLEAHGIAARPQLRGGEDAPVVTDDGNLIYDASCGAITDAEVLAERLKATTGVVEHGLFLDLAQEALIGTDDGIERLGRRRTSGSLE